MLAAMVLTGGELASVTGVILIVALACFYLGGMYLNDAFDADIDAIDRPDRPIPAGEVSKTTVFRIGFALLAAGVIQLSIAGLMADPMRIGWPTVSGVVLVGAIVLYNSDHKENPLSPVVMGLCRVLIYVSVGQCFMTTLPIPLLIGALALLSYLIGLTYVAKQENLGQVKNLWPLLFLAAPAVYGSILGVASGVTLAYCGLFIVWMLVAVWLVRRRAPGDIPRAVVSLIAGISLLDAVLISSAGEPYLALLAVLGFAFTLILQRVVSGT